MMRERFDTPYERQVYSHRMETVVPVFGHLRGAKKVKSFSTTRINQGKFSIAFVLHYAQYWQGANIRKSGVVEWC
ncbi:MAG: hypothetical protein A2015_13045 [Spirochaetes bacterium GWF1_31_7]|nr:MAG: hypothetical protein A2Y29_00895 [Spirochaetes bacterium GWE2_31_10]OHD51509.1 MAG: hypothetical protein A2015_13045 [Spirochaetes bacterium GWF1_31_7]